MSLGRFEDQFVSLNDTFVADIQIAKRVSNHAISAGVVKDEFGFEVLDVLLNHLLHFGQIGLIAVSGLNEDFPLDAFSSLLVIRVYVRVVEIYYIGIIITQEVSFMTIALMSVKVDNHGSFHSEVSPCSLYCLSDIVINTKATTSSLMSVMIPTTEVYCEAFLHRHYHSINGALSGLQHRIQETPSEDTIGQKVERHLYYL